MAVTDTTNRNPDAYETFDGTKVLPINPANIVNVGDLIMWDPASSHYSLRVPLTQADMTLSGGGYMGVAEQCNPVTSLNDTGVYLQIRRTGVVQFYQTAGDVYTPFCPVYFNETVNVQTVTADSASGARSIVVGFYVPDNNQTVQGAYGTRGNITGVSGSLITIWLTPHFPAGV